TNGGAATTMYVGLGGTYNGNVGIGTTTPGAKFHDAGNSLFGDLMRIQGGATVPSGTSGIGLEMWSDAGTAYLQSFNRTTTAYSLMSFYGSNFGFMTGNLGVGTTGPGTAIDVSRTSADAFIRAQTTTSGNAG